MRRWFCIGEARAHSATLTAALSVCISAATIATCPCAEARQINWSIPSQPLQTALVSFAIQANVSISTPPRGFSGRRAPSVSGVMGEEEALAHLLADSGYTYVRVNAAAYRIVPGAQPTQPQQRVDAPERVEIVITARHRPEVLLDAPTSATAIDGDELRDLGVRGASDVLLTAAGLSTSNLGPGRNKIFIRGLSDGAFTGRAESTVGVYYENSRLIDTAPDPDLALIDVDAVEILRGPQGALYGGGAIAGIYRIMPRTPDLQNFGGEVSTQFESTGGATIGNSVAAVINAPIAKDRLGARFVGYRQSEAGWLDNPILGLRDTNETRRVGGRLTLAGEARNGWTFSGALVQQYIDSEDGQYVDLSRGEARPTRLLEPHDNDFRLVSFSVRGPTRIGAFSATTSLVHHSFDNTFDATDALTSLGAPPGATTAFGELHTLKYVNQQVRLSGVASPFPWSIGAFLSLGDGRQVSSAVTDPETPSETTIYASARSDDIHRYGIFGDAMFTLMPSLTLDLSARVFHSELNVDATAASSVSAFNDNFKGRITRSGWAPGVQLSYQRSPNANYYALLSQGYRYGGFNTGAAGLLTEPDTTQPIRRYDGDRIWNFEVGAKYRLLDDRWRVRLAVFHQLWEDVQTDQLVTSGLSFTGNVGDATNNGIEIESVFSPSEEWRLSTQFTYVAPEIESIAQGFPASDSLPGAPHLLASSTLQWRRETRLGVVQAHLAGFYVGSADIEFLDGRRRDVGGYFEGDARLSLTHDAWQAAFYVDNLADTQASTFSYGSPFNLTNPNISTPLRPRTFGLELRRAF